MEYGSLDDLVKRSSKALRWKIRLRLLHDIVLGMEYIHKKNITHRDLKCKNVLLTKEKGLLRAKVADFGTSHFAKQRSMSITNELETKDSDSRARTVSTEPTTTRCAQSHTKDIYTTMTRAGVGTYAYMAPETWRAMANEKDPVKLSNKIDVYAFSMIMWEVLMQRGVWHQYPTQWKSIRDEVLAVQRPKFRQFEIKNLPKNFPRHNVYYNLMDRCWKQNPEERPAFSEISKDVQKWVNACTDDDDNHDKNEEKEEEKENDREAVRVPIQELVDSDSDEEDKEVVILKSQCDIEEEEVKVNKCLWKFN